MKKAGGSMKKAGVFDEKRRHSMHCFGIHTMEYFAPRFMQTVAYHSTNCLGTHTAEYSGSKPPLGTLKDPHGGLDPE